MLLLTTNTLNNCPCDYLGERNVNFLENCACVNSFMTVVPIMKELNGWSFTRTHALITPNSICLFRSTIKTLWKCETCSKLITKTSEQRQLFVLVSFLLALNFEFTRCSVSIADFGQENASWNETLVIIIGINEIWKNGLTLTFNCNEMQN